MGNSPLVLGCPSDQKARCADGIVDWYRRVKGIEISPSEVYMFDDRKDATEGFEKYGFNARQVSCGSREVGGLAEEGHSDMQSKAYVGPRLAGNVRSVQRSWNGCPKCECNRRRGGRPREGQREP